MTPPTPRVSAELFASPSPAQSRPLYLRGPEVGADAAATRAESRSSLAPGDILPSAGAPATACAGGDIFAPVPYKGAHSATRAGAHHRGTDGAAAGRPRRRRGRGALRHLSKPDRPRPLFQPTPSRYFPATTPRIAFHSAERRPRRFVTLIVARPLVELRHRLIPGARAHDRLLLPALQRAELPAAGRDVLKMVACRRLQAGSKATARSTPTRPRSPNSSAHLGDSGLKMTTGHFGLDMLEKEPDSRPRHREGRRRRDDLLPLPRPRPAPRPTGAALPTSAGGCKRRRKPYRDAGLGFGWHNHDFEFKAARRRLGRRWRSSKAAPTSMEADIAWVVRGGADPLQWIKTGQAPHRGPCQGHRPRRREADEDGWADVGHGTVDWKALMAALRRIPGRRTSSWSTTTRRTPGASPSARSPPRSNSEGGDHDQAPSASASSAAATSRRPISGSRRCSMASRSAPAPTSRGRGRGPGQGVRRQGAIVDDLLANPDIDVVINLTIPDAHFAVTRARSKPASTSIPRSRSCSPSRRA